MEEWENIKGYENLYQISNKGRIRSLDKIDSIGRKVKGRVMKPSKRKDGYLQIMLHKSSKYKMFLIHTLVASAFIDNPNGYKEINHKDENKLNNNVKNLEWCNRTYNINYGSGNIGRAKTIRELKSKKVLQLLGNTIIKEWNSTTEAEKEGYKHQSISRCCNGIRETHKGYRWQYIN